MFIMGSLISTVEKVSFSEKFYETKYQELNTAKDLDMSQDDLMASTHVLLDYIKDNRDSIDLVVNVDGINTEMFNTREKDHMVDVKNIFMKVNLLKDVFFLVSKLLFFFAIVTKDIYKIRVGLDIIKKSLMITTVIVGSVIFYALFDFDSFWVTFHELLFTNDLWLLNPATDRMINMFPQPFFNAMVLRIIGLYLFQMGIVALGYGIFYKYQIRKVDAL